MPTLLALLLASCVSFLFGQIPLGLPLWIHTLLAAPLWLVVFIAMKKMLSKLRP